MWFLLGVFHVGTARNWTLKKNLAASPRSLWYYIPLAPSRVNIFWIGAWRNPSQQEYQTIVSVKYQFCWKIFLADNFTESNKYENFLYLCYSRIKVYRIQFSNFLSWQTQLLKRNNTSQYFIRIVKKKNKSYQTQFYFFFRWVLLSQNPPLSPPPTVISIWVRACTYSPPSSLIVARQCSLSFAMMFA